MPNQEEVQNWQRADDEVRMNLPESVKLVRTLRGHTSQVGRIAWSPDGRLVASPSKDKTIRLWDAGTGECLRALNGHSEKIYCVAFDPTGATLASGSWDKTVKIWDVTTGRLIRTLEGHQGAVGSVGFDPTGRQLASGSEDCTVKLWDVTNGRLIRTLDGHLSPVVSVAFDSLGWQLASGGDDQTVKLWQADSGHLLYTLEGHKGSVVSVELGRVGRLVGSGSVDNTIKLWDSASGRLLRTIEGHTSSVNCIGFSPDGRCLASKSSDGSIRLWRAESGERLATISEPVSEEWCPGLAFHPQRHLLASVGSDPGTSGMDCDRVIHLYELDFDLLLGLPGKSSVSHTSAKVVLVGESNVGKSYLAHRLATREAPEVGAIKSTHGMKFWPMEPERLSPLAKAPPGERREVVLWDMGGQDEYRLIHQLFLHDTTLALVLFDPTRGAAAFKEVETWNKALENQLRGRAAVKLLVGAKLDEASDIVDAKAVQRLVIDCGFAGFYETSAITGRGIGELCDAVSKAIDWDFNKTSRPELFQAIRDEIESRRKNGVIVVLFDDLNQDLHTNDELETFELLHHEVALASSAEAGTRALDAVCGQLAQQGVIARAKTSSGKSALILRVEEVERYAGSLIIAAKKNLLGVPALELRAIAQENFSLPGILDHERLARAQEKPVLECTVQLMLEHGICFQHEGLLIFPSLFAPSPDGVDGKLVHSVSLYYDFAGAIDNIYASMVAWLVLAKEFGKVRLWSDRAEFEVKDGGLCGLRKVGRPGGFAHVDVYFEQETPEQKRKEFISFVEDHLARNGVEIREHVAIKCPCGYEFSEDVLRQRIARGDKDVVCPICEKRHNLTEGASQSRERDAKISQHTWALRTRIEKLRERLTKSVVEVLGDAEAVKSATSPLRLLHLSDLHFTAATPVAARLQWLIDDIKQDGGLGFKELDYLVISGDFTDKGSLDGFEKAYEFVSRLTQEFGLSAERCIFVPGNHDVSDLEEAYDWKKKPDGLKDGEWVKQGEIYLAQNKGKYPWRLKAFSDAFFHKFVQRPYPLDYSAQGIAVPFWETGLQFLMLNSCWQIDGFHRKRSGVHVEAVANAIKEAQKQETAARESGQFQAGKPLLRIAVWHHAVAGPEQMSETTFLTNLQKAGVRLGIHGDIHELRRDVVGHWHEQGKQLHILGAGSFGSPPEGRPESMPRLYNVIEIDRGLTSMKVHTRQQPKVDGAWTGWHDWPNPKDNSSKVAYYDIAF